MVSLFGFSLVHDFWYLPFGRSRHNVVHLQDMHQEIQDVLGQNFGIPDDIDEDELMEELDALEDDLTADTEANADGVPSYLQVVLSASVQMLGMHTYSYTCVSICCCNLSCYGNLRWALHIIIAVLSGLLMDCAYTLHCIFSDGFDWIGMSASLVR